MTVTDIVCEDANDECECSTVVMDIVGGEKGVGSRRRGEEGLIFMHQNQAQLTFMLTKPLIRRLCSDAPLAPCFHLSSTFSLAMISKPFEPERPPSMRPLSLSKA